MDIISMLGKGKFTISVLDHVIDYNIYLMALSLVGYFLDRAKPNIDFSRTLCGKD